MAKVITVWGCPNSGKTTLAVNLACAYEEANYTVGVISAADYGELQTHFGVTVPNDKGLYKALTDVHQSIRNIYTLTGKKKSIFLLSAPDEIDSFVLSVIDREQTDRAVHAAADSFDIVIIDADSSKNNPMTGSSIIKADTIIVPVKNTASWLLWYKANRRLLDSIAPKAKYANYANRATEDVTDLQYIAKMPYVPEAEELHTEGSQIYYGRSRAAKEYMRKCDELIKNL